MLRLRDCAVVCCLTSISVVLSSCGGVGSGSTSGSGTTMVQVSVSETGAGQGMISSTPAGIDCGQACSANFTSGTQVTLTAAPTGGSYFGGWSGACSGVGVCQMTLTKNVAATASFDTLPVLAVTLAGTGTGTVTSNPSGINCGQTCKASFNPGEQVILTATAGANSHFSGWGGACSASGSNSTCTVSLSASQQVTATFDSTLSGPVLAVSRTGTGTGTVVSNPAGINCGTTCSANFASGTSVTLTETSAANSTFAGWSGGGCSGDSTTCVVTLSTSQNVTATFTLNQSVFALGVSLAGSGTGMVASNPQGISCQPTCSANFTAGTQVTLTETPGANSTFAGWSGGGCSGSSPTCVVMLTANQNVTATFNPSQGVFSLSVSLAGSGTGTVTSNPAGISCQPTCSANFNAGTQVSLTETPGAGSNFAGWGGACSGSDPTCTLTLTANQQVTATFSPQSLTAINHIIFMAQENRSFDHYLGTLRAYWAANNIPDQSLDGLPQFNPTTGIPPLYGPPPTNQGCDPAYPPPADCRVDSSSPTIQSFPLITQCVEDPEDKWSESHLDWNLFDPYGDSPTMNGFVYGAANIARGLQFYDSVGIRTMGYNSSTDLNYYYFMATSFATSDRWFSPVMGNTPPNREYLDAATSQGYVHTIPTSVPPLTATTIFEELQDAGITWKIYVNPEGSTCTGPPYDPSCLLGLSTIQVFAWGQTIPKDYPNNIAPISQYFTDLQNDTLPQVAIIEPASLAGLDEHPTNKDNAPNDIQRGANYVSTLINGLMQSNSWQDSAFILTYDEFGGLYDHVPTQPTVSPDGIKPVDLLPTDVCYSKTGPTCDFVYTGYRMPLIVVSPFTKKNYVSHTVADSTAILKLIETRFNVPALTKRDAAQMDMTEFFDFTNPPWLTPPTPPAQVTNGACYVNKLP